MQLTVEFRVEPLFRRYGARRRRHLCSHREPAARSLRAAPLPASRPPNQDHWGRLSREFASPIAALRCAPAIQSTQLDDPNALLIALTTKSITGKAERTNDVCRAFSRAVYSLGCRHKKAGVPASANSWPARQFDRFGQRKLAWPDGLRAGSPPSPSPRLIRPTVRLLLRSPRLLGPGPHLNQKLSGLARQR